MKALEALRRQLLAARDWPADSFVVGACGGMGWRKGSDLFVQLARRLHAEGVQRPMRFLWVGGDATDIEALRFAHDLHALGLQAVVHHTASTAEVQHHYSAMDVFALTSREDPFPLVMLEAGLHGVPTVCFSGSGGAPEFVSNDAGIVVPHLDIGAFADAIDGLRAVPDRCRALGLAARQKVMRHHGIETGAPALLRSIERCLALA